MAAINLSNYNLSELKALQQDIERAIQERQQQDVKKAREQILAIAQDVGIPIEQLVINSARKGNKEKRKKVEPQFQNPTDNLQTWSGRGRQPRWIQEGLATGKNLDDFRI